MAEEQRGKTPKGSSVAQKADTILNLFEAELSKVLEGLYDQAFASRIGERVRKIYARNQFVGKAVVGGLRALIQKWEPPPGPIRTFRDMLEDLPFEIRRRIDPEWVPPHHASDESEKKSAETKEKKDDMASEADVAKAVASIVHKKEGRETPADVEIRTAEKRGTFVSWLINLDDEDQEIVLHKSSIFFLAKLDEDSRETTLELLREYRRKNKEKEKEERRKKEAEEGRGLSASDREKARQQRYEDKRKKLLRKHNLR